MRPQVLAWKLPHSSQSSLSSLIVVLFTATIFARMISSSSGQSTCNFMSDFSLSDASLQTVPAEPADLFATLQHCSAPPSSRVPRTCCSASAETELAEWSKTELERTVKRQIAVLRDSFGVYALLFERHVRASLRLAERQLNDLFEKTYGPYFTANSMIFERFFQKLDARFVQAVGGTSADERKSISDSPTGLERRSLDELFEKIFLTEFALLNPLAEIGTTERTCLQGMLHDLKPFGALPKKIDLLLSRSLDAWEAVVGAMRRASVLLKNLDENVNLSASCVSRLTRMRQCHLCAGEPTARPCFNLCWNVLSGCFGDIAELDAEFNAFIDALFQLSGRLKSVHNPYNVLASVPVQISEAIMNFQERSFYFSNRIQLRCFQQRLRFRRSVSVQKDIRPLDEEYDDEYDEDEESEEQFEVNDNYDEEEEGDHDAAPKIAEGEIRQDWKYYYEESGRMADTLRQVVVDYIDKLSRMRGFWRSMPEMFCEEGGLSVERHSNGDHPRCWNGTAVARYRYRAVVVGDRRWLAINPEFQWPITLNFSEAEFSTERRQLLNIANRLNTYYESQRALPALYGGEGSAAATASDVNSTKITDDLTISIDDEDSMVAESSGLSLVDLEYSADEMTEASSTPPLNGQYSKLFTSIRHPTTNTTVLVTKHVPSSMLSGTGEMDNRGGALRIAVLILVILMPRWF